MTIEHNAAAGEYCPLCHSIDLEGGFVEIEAQSANQECSCNECGAEWIDHYKIEYVDIITMPKFKLGLGQGRLPTKEEIGAITKLFEGYQPGIIMVYDNYISDGPGYAGWLAVTVGGEPQFCATFTKDKGDNEIILCSQVTA